MFPNSQHPPRALVWRGGTRSNPAIAALSPRKRGPQAADIPHEVLQYGHDPRHPSFGEEAVEALARSEGVEPMQVFKTLVLALPRGLGVAVLPVPAKLSLKAAAAALGVPKVTMAERAAAERSTGYVLGGISLLGQRTPLPTVVDTSALGWDRVLCSAGKRGWNVALPKRDLIRLTNAVTADICAP